MTSSNMFMQETKHNTDMLHQGFFARLFAIYFNILLILHCLLTYASGIVNSVSTKFYDGIGQFTMQKYMHTQSSNENDMYRKYT